jgi:hypothetical protein
LIVISQYYKSTIQLFVVFQKWSHLAELNR